MEELFREAEAWAHDLWSRASENWKTREQDHNYRQLVTRPKLREIIRSIPMTEDGCFLDIGCGDGSETKYVEGVLYDAGSRGRMYAYDPQSSLVNSFFLELPSRNRKMPYYLGDDDFQGFLEHYDLAGKVDLATSLFVLQDLPGIEDHLANVYTALKPDGTSLMLLVHPDFGESMRRKRTAKVNKRLHPRKSTPNWRWAAQYPIVEEHGNTFYVPYFQRTVDDYIRLLDNAGLNVINLTGLKPSTEAIEEAEKNKISPLYKHKGNLYYPEIVNQESSLIIVARKC